MNRTLAKETDVSMRENNRSHELQKEIESLELELKDICGCVLEELVVDDGSARSGGVK